MNRIDDTFRFTDVLTGLFNRKKMQEILVNNLLASTDDQYGAFVFIDIDNFKRINDAYGYDIGDMLLAEVARHIKICAGECASVARMGGDEFAVLMKNIGNTEKEAIAAAAVLGREIISTFELPINIDGRKFNITPSIGIATFCGGTKSDKDILKQADSARYLSKNKGRNRISFHCDKVAAELKWCTDIEKKLQDAILDSEMELYFQPIINQNGVMQGAEALLRWKNDGVDIPPLSFIPVAESSGMIAYIGTWVMKRACLLVRKWEDMNLMSRDFVLSVNISPMQLCRIDFVDRVLLIISEAGVDPHRIKLEITESSIIENIDEAIIKIRTLKQAGVDVVMDDFGTGHSSLSCLRHLPISQIKIDKSFVDNIEHNWNDEAVIRIIASLGRALRVSVLAEGVENARQHRMLEMAGCSFFQGYHFSRPLPAGEFEKLLAIRTPDFPPQ